MPERRNTFPGSIKRKLLVPILLCIVVSNAVYTAFWADRYSTQLNKEFDVSVELARSFVAPSIVDAVWNFDNDSAATTLRGLQELDAFSFARVIVEGKPFAQGQMADKWNPFWDDAIQELGPVSPDGQMPQTVAGVDGAAPTLPILYMDTGDTLIKRSILSTPDGKYVGEMVLAFSTAQMKQSMRAAWMQATTIGLLVAALVGAVVYVSALRVARPLADLIGTLDQLGLGQTKIDVPHLDRNDELGRLAHAVTGFRDSLVENRAMEEARQADSQQQQVVVTALADALRHLAAGRLNGRIAAKFVGEYVKLQSDFHSAMSVLDGSMGVITDNATEVSAKSVEIERAITALAGRTERQSFTLNEIIESAKDISKKARISTEASTQIDGVIEETNEHVHRNRALIQDATSAMNAIETSSAQISSITELIDDIAFQTKLLALNAGVEAARAGEHGRGFAIVASEVRGLAQRSADASKDIRSLIKESAHHVSTGSSLVGQSSESLAKVVDLVSSARTMAQEVKTAAADNTHAVDEIVNSIQQLENVTQENAAMAEQTTAATSMMNEQLEDLIQAISKFEISQTSDSGGAIGFAA